MFAPGEPESHVTEMHDCFGNRLDGMKALPVPHFMSINFSLGPHGELTSFLECMYLSGTTCLASIDREYGRCCYLGSNPSDDTLKRLGR